MQPPPPLRSALDSARFGFGVGKAYPAVGADLARLLAQSRAEGLRLLFARCPTEDATTTHALEREGFLLMDTLVYLRRPVAAGDAVAVPGVRAALPGDGPAIGRVAGRAFDDYVSHYHADPRLPRGAVAQIYPDWATRAAGEPGLADHVLVAEREGRVAGFAVLRRLDAGCCDGVLYGVDPDFRGRGVYRSLLAASFAWAAASGFAEMEYSTQLRNLTALRTVARLGFVPERSLHTFHRWFD